jgi:hypothetical protein
MGQSAGLADLLPVKGLVAAVDVAGVRARLGRPVLVPRLLKVGVADGVRLLRRDRDRVTHVYMVERGQAAKDPLSWR